ncbi:MAG TPA: hypothetical protein VF451_01690, partial [Acidobacteriota bacterium]
MDRWVKIIKGFRLIGSAGDRENGPLENFSLLALGDIVDDAHGMPAALDLDGGQRQGHIDFPAIPAQPLQFKGPADGPPAARAQELGKSGSLGFVKALRN